MIKKLCDDNRDNVLNFLLDEAAFNLFIIGDILNNGFDKEYMEVWGDFNDIGDLKAVLLRYFNNYIPYYKDMSYDTAGFADIISGRGGKRLISGKSDVVNNFRGVLENCVLTDKYFCQLQDKSKLLDSTDRYLVKRATIEDAERLSDMIDSIAEFANTGESREMLENTIANGSGRYYYIEDEDKNILSVAGTSAENKYAAMIVSVATVLKNRRQGLAKACLGSLCRDTLRDCQSLCLFYSNLEAGSIYHAIGFETIGMWTMLSGS